MEFDEVVLRACNVEDAAALALVGAATFLDTYAGWIDGRAIVAHCAKQHSAAVYERYLGQPRCQAWLAETREGSAPVGYAMLTEPDLPLAGIGAGDIELKRIYLLSRFHGNGAGRRLLEATAKAAHETGCSRILLGVNRDNGRALSFYRRNGFVEVGVRTFSVGDQVYDDLVLGRGL